MVMLREHGELWATMDLLESALREGPHADGVHEACTELMAQLASHNLKEEPIIYPQADRILTSEASAELPACLESGQLLEGWVCERAPS